jgi:hypothetical protein
MARLKPCPFEGLWMPQELLAALSEVLAAISEAVLSELLAVLSEVVAALDGGGDVGFEFEPVG